MGLGMFSEYLGAFWQRLERLGCVLEAFGERLGWFGRALGVLWGCLCVFEKVLGAVWRRLGIFGNVLERLEASGKRSNLF